MKPNLIREYFYIPKKERIVIFVLLLVINAFICLIYLFNDRDESAVVLKQYSNSISKQELKNKNSLDSPIKQKEIRVNFLELEGWVQLGFSEKQSHMILNYKERIDGFRDTKDLLKVYCIEKGFIDEFGDQLVFDEMYVSNKSDYLKSDSTIRSNQLESIEKDPNSNLHFDINKCSASDLIQLPGIGKVLSRRIIKYRDLLGGFHNLNQISEVYGMSEENYTKFIPFLVINSSVKKMNINSADFKELIRHPYLMKIHVSAILNYREQHGKYSAIEDLKKLYSIPDSVYIKITPYLNIDR